MKTSGNKIRLTRVLRHTFMGLTIALGLLTLLNLTSYLGISSDGPYIRGWVTTAPQAGMEQASQDSPDQQMKLYEFSSRKLVMVEFSGLPAMMQLRYLGYILFQQIPWLLGIAILYLMYAIFRDMDKGQVFPMENVRRIRTIALAALVFPFVGYAASIMLWAIVQPQAGPSVLPPFAPLLLEPALQSAFIALVLFGLAEAFRAGAHLEQEQELTI